MKLRTGFVSNSSSSSFVIVFNTEIDPLLSKAIKALQETGQQEFIKEILEDISGIREIDELSKQA